MNLQDAARFLRYYWWLIVLAFFVGFGSTALFTSRRAATYRAATTLVVGPSENITAPKEIVDSLDTLDRRSVVATFAKVPSSRTVRERAEAQLQLARAQTEPYQVKTVVVPDTNILEVSVEGPDPQLTANFVNAIAEQTRRYAQEFYLIYGMKVLDRAEVPTEPVRAAWLRELGVGGAVGLLLGLLFALALNYLRQWKRARMSRLRPTQKVERYT
ncbi:MAG TPA: hypothetical protein VF666_03070 [Pyrinomonadaceae bacterium]|jgi:uncharacterized protein involved in exopolysaccharide biosynthesis